MAGSSGGFERVERVDRAERLERGVLPGVFGGSGEESSGAPNLGNIGNSLLALMALFRDTLSCCRDRSQDRAKFPATWRRSRFGSATGAATTRGLATTRGVCAGDRVFLGALRGRVAALAFKKLTTPDSASFSIPGVPETGTDWTRRGSGLVCGRFGVRDRASSFFVRGVFLTGLGESRPLLLLLTTCGDGGGVEAAGLGTTACFCLAATVVALSRGTGDWVGLTATAGLFVKVGLDAEVGSAVTFGSAVTVG